MKEMVGGCCVCSDERGWPDNPLVYCDGNGCTVAVHQACYGIVTVPTGPWFCRKCESPDRQARVRCELCPSRAGALKRSDSGGWAHVVCALYIPEVRFGNVTSMEPIILQLIPSERFNKTCYICQESGKVNRAAAGACMQCNKSGCKQQFHVTCAQSLGLLCEEAGNYLDNVKYCGYCRHHYGKLKKGGNVKTIPPYKPISQDSHSSDSSPEKDLDASPPGAVSGSSISDPAIPLISLLSSSSSKGSSKASTPGRKSGQSSQNSSTENLKATTPRVVTTKTPTHATSSESASTSVAFPKQSPHNSKAITSSKPSVSQGKGDKGGRKKSPSPGDRKAPPSSAETVPITVSIPSVSPHSQAKANQQSSVNKLHQEPVVIINELPISTTSSGTTIITSALLEQIGALKFTNSNFTESVITQSDSVFGIGAESKQTKKRKAINQATASTSGYQVPSSTITSAKVSDSSSSGDMLWDGPIPLERALDPSREDKTKKVIVKGRKKRNFRRTKKKTLAVKLDAPQQQSSSKPSTSSQIGGLNIQMEPNLSSAHYSTANISSNPPSLASTQSSPEKIYTLSSSTSSTSLEMISAPSPNLNTHVQNLSQKYPNVAQGRSDESPTSLVVSVPLPQAGPVIQLTGHQNLSQKYPRADEPPASLVVSVPLPQAGPVIQPTGHQAATTEATFIPPASPGPSSSSWGLKITYEPNTQPVPAESLVVDEQSVPATRLRSESTDSGLRSHQPGVILDNSDKSQTSGGARNKKKVPSTKYDSTASSSSTAIPPQQKRKKTQSSPLTPTSSQELTLYFSPPSSPGFLFSSVSSFLFCRVVSPTSPVDISVSASINIIIKPILDHDINTHLLPPAMGSETAAREAGNTWQNWYDSRAARNVKSNIEKMARAPHMLGNELNPESAAAARLSEHLNAELAAHSVFRAPSPLVPPPLINRATSSRNISAAAGGPSTSAVPSTSGAPPSSSSTADSSAGVPPVGLGGSAQSLDQLLERQWEQGSQFLMEQAQHFDIASLLSCLHQLRTENVRLQDYIGSLSQRRDHLLAVNARLAIPLNAVNVPAEVPRGPRDNNGNNVRPPNPVRADGNRSNSLERQQMANRDTQPKSS